MAEVDVAGVGQDQGSEEPMLLLRERGGQRRYIAIWVGAVEATAVAAAASASQLPRPLTHRLLLDVVGAFGAELERVEVTAIVDDQFHAELTVRTAPDASTTVSSRASDAIALAVHQGCPIEVADAVLAEAALPPGVVANATGEGDGDDGDSGDEGSPSEGGVPDDPAQVEAEIEELRRALAEATPDDFRAQGGEGGGDRPAG